jgi:acyl carrier protein
LSYNPLFQVMFNFHDSQVPELRFGELNGTLQYRQNSSAKFDHNIVVIPRFAHANDADPEAGDERLLIEWEYSTDLFDEATMQRMVGHYRALLESVVAAPEQRIADLPMLTADEQRQLLVEWNAGRTASTHRQNSRPQRTPAERPFTPARTPDEESLVSIWREFLGVERVGVHDDFFELGGHSIQITKMLARVSEVFGVELTLGDFFESSQVGGLAARISRERERGEAERQAEILRLLDALSEDEIDARLDQRA